MEYWSSSTGTEIVPLGDEDRTANGGEIVAGVLLAASGTFCASLANILVKTDHHKNTDKPEDKQKPCWRRPIWYLIFTLYIVGGVLDFAAYGLAPLSLLAPVASLTIVMNAILAYFAFSEKLTYRDLVGSVIIIVSAVVATAFGSRESAVIDLEGLLRLWRHDVWLVFMSFELFLMIAAYALVHVWDPAWPGWSVWWRAYRTVKCGDCCGGCCIDSRDRDSSATVIVRSPLASTDNSERAAVLNGSSASSDLSVPIAVADTPPVLQPNKSLGSVVAGDGSSARITDVDDLTSPNAADGASSPQSPDSEAVQAALAAVKAGRPLTPVAAVSLMGRASVPTDPWSQSLHGMRAVMYAFLTSSAGAWTNILGKCCSALMRETAEGNNQWGRGESWAMLLALPFFAILQLRFMSEMMAIFEAVLIVPIYQCIFMIWLIICGQVYFQEFDKLPAKNIGIFFAAVAVCGFGVFILTRRPPPTEQQILDQKTQRIAKAAARKQKKADAKRASLAASAHGTSDSMTTPIASAGVTPIASTPTLTVPSQEVISPSESRGSTDSGKARPAFDLSPSAVAAAASASASASINVGGGDGKLSETARLVPVTSADSSLLATSALSDSTVPVVQLTLPPDE